MCRFCNMGLISRMHQQPEGIQDRQHARHVVRLPRNLLDVNRQLKKMLVESDALSGPRTLIVAFVFAFSVSRYRLVIPPIPSAVSTAGRTAGAATAAAAAVTAPVMVAFLISSPTNSAKSRLIPPNSYESSVRPLARCFMLPRSTFWVSAEVGGRMCCHTLSFKPESERGPAPRIPTGGVSVRGGRVVRV